MSVIYHKNQAVTLNLPRRQTGLFQRLTINACLYTFRHISTHFDTFRQAQCKSSM